MEIFFFAKKTVGSTKYHVQDTLFKTLNSKILHALLKNQDPENQTLCSLTRLGRTGPCNFSFVLFYYYFRIKTKKTKIHDHSISLAGLKYKITKTRAT